MERDTRFVVGLGTAVFALAFFSGCKPLFDFFRKKPEEKVEEVRKEVVETKKEEAMGPILLSIDGKSVLKESDFNKHLAQMLQMNPYFRGAGAESLPVPLKRKFFDELSKQEIILAWANKNNIASDPEFKKSYDDMKKLVKRSLLVQRFESKLFEDIEITDREIKEHFEKEKSKFIKEPGGVLVSGIKFDDSEKATKFYDSVKNKASQFDELAKKDNEENFKAFGRISKEQQDLAGSDVPAAVKEKVLSLTKFPAIEKIKIGKNVWVIHASDKQDAKFFELDEVRPQLESMLKNNKFRDVLDARIKKLEGEFTIDRNYDYFKEIQPQESIRRNITKKAEKKEEKLPSPSAVV